MYEYAHAFPALLDVKQWLKFASHVHSSLTIGVDNQLLYLKDYIWSTSFFFFFVHVYTVLTVAEKLILYQGCERLNSNH